MEEFLTLAETRSFTEAAKKCHVSQSSLSKHIAAMEAELGVDLLRRPSNPVKLTRAGWSFAHDSRALVNDYKGALERIEAVKKDKNQVIVLGYYLPVAAGALDAIHKYTVRHKSSFEIKPVSLGATQIRASLEEKRVDAVITVDPGNELDSICNSIIFKQEHMLLAVSKSHPLAKFDEVKLVDLEGELFLKPGKGVWPVISSHLESVLGHLSGYRNGRELDDVDTVIFGVVGNMGIAMVLDHNRSRYGGKIRFLHVREEDESDFSVPLKLAWLKEAEESRSKSRHIDHLKRIFKSFSL